MVTLLIFLRAVRLQRDRFQMEPASLKRHNYLDTENRNTETKAVFNFSLTQLILNGSHGAADESADKGRQPFKASITRYKFQEMSATSVHPVFDYSWLLW